VDIGLKEKVEKALMGIRPYLEEDGGDIAVLDISREKVVMLELTGACGTCPMSSMTLKAGVEKAIMESVPEIMAVEAINITPPNQELI